MLKVGDIISYTAVYPLSNRSSLDGLYIVSIAEKDWFRAIKPNSDDFLVLSYDSLQMFIHKGEMEILTKK